VTPNVHLSGFIFIGIFVIAQSLDKDLICDPPFFLI